MGLTYHDFKMHVSLTLDTFTNTPLDNLAIYTPVSSCQTSQFTSC